MSELATIRTVSVPSIGKLPLAEKPGKFTPSGSKREHKPGRLAGDGGHITTPKPAMAELTLNNVAGLDLQALYAVEDEDITVRMSDGTVHLMKQAFAQEPQGTGDDGTVQVTFIANTSEVM